MEGTINLKLNNYYNMDCMDGMKLIPDKYFELAIVDPPYGHCEIGTNRSGLVRQKNGTIKRVESKMIGSVDWNIAPDEVYFKELLRISKNQIIWGVNYLDLPKEYNSGGRIVWDKCNDGTVQSDCEIAYNSLSNKVDIFRYMWRGMMQGKSIIEGHIQQGNKSKNENRIHAMQKPVALYKWQLMKYAKIGWKIVDTHVGSASSLIACHQMGFEFMGFEKDKDNYKKSKIRLESVRAQLSIFEMI